MFAPSFGWGLFCFAARPTELFGGEATPPTRRLLEYIPKTKSCFLINLIISGLFGVFDPTHPLFPVTGDKSPLDRSLRFTRCSCAKTFLQAWLSHSELHLIDLPGYQHFEHCPYPLLIAVSLETFVGFFILLHVDVL